MSEIRKMPRGVRNNNPGNIRKTPINWQGETESDREKEFEVFERPEDGLRALMKLLLTYYAKYQLDTVHSIINRWAPPVENATDAYAFSVAKRLGVRRTDVIDVTDPRILKALAQAIVIHENGHPPKTYPDAWYPDAIYDLAVSRALGLN